MMRRTRAVLGLILTLALLILSAACSSKEENGGANTADTRNDTAPTATKESTRAEQADQTPLDLIRAVPDMAAEAKTVSIDGTITMEGVPGYKTEGLTMTMTGAVDMANNRAHLSMGGFGMDTEMIQDGTAMYLKMAALGNRWIKVDYSTILGEADSQQFLGGGQSNPTAMIENLRGISGNVEDLGTETIRGVEATHYRATVSVAKSLEEARKYLDEDLQAWLDQAASILSDEYPVEVWIDSDNLLRRMSLTMSYGEGVPGLEGVTMSMSTDYFDYGKPVTIDTPRENEVDDWSDLFGSLMGGQTP